MLNTKSFLTADLGAANSKLAEFDITEDGGLLLKQYGFTSLGQEGLQETTRHSALLKSLQAGLSEQAFKSKAVNVCAPGFNTFSKFVKLPPVDTSKVTQIIQYEAQQNVPFPLEEVVWDYQILGAAPSGELEVLLVAIKSDIVEGLFSVAQSAGLRLQLVDVSPAALCNAYRYNYPDNDGCTVLLDIGAKTSNLLFFEKTTVYSRSISIGANAITTDFMKETRLSFAEAERIKIEQGFVSLGGAYEEPENAHQAAISKIARQVMTRLHMQVNQTIQHYRTNQGGSVPTRLLLAGGGSIMPYTAQFFCEKLNLPPENVEYFNPLRGINIAPELNREELAKVAHSMGEVVGLGLRNLAHCPIELNLVPKSSRKRQEFDQKKPYLVASAVFLLLVLFAIGWFYKGVADEKASALATVEERLAPLQRDQAALGRVMNELTTVEGEAEQYVTWIEDRQYWGAFLSQIRNSLMAVEGRQKQALNTDAGVWVEKLVPVLCGNAATVVGPWVQDSASVTPPPGSVDSFGTPIPQPTPAPGAAGRRGRRGGRGAVAGTNGEICKVVFQCRAVNLSTAAPDANSRIAFDLQKELTAQTDYFETNGIVLGTVTPDPSDITFSFEITATLKRPMKL